MSRSEESKRLLAEANTLLDQHAKLMRSEGHDGAAHCPCELARQYRMKDAEFWISRKSKVKSEKP